MQRLDIVTGCSKRFSTRRSSAAWDRFASQRAGQRVSRPNAGEMMASIRRVQGWVVERRHWLLLHCPDRDWICSSVRHASRPRHTEKSRVCVVRAKADAGAAVCCCRRREGVRAVVADGVLATAMGRWSRRLGIATDDGETGSKRLVGLKAGSSRAWRSGRLELAPSSLFTPTFYICSALRLLLLANLLSSRPQSSICPASAPNGK